MADPASGQSAFNSTPGASGPANPSRWARSGEPGSAFSGLSRGTRGRGHNRGRGGGRGGRGGANSREAKIGDTSREKIDTTTRLASATNAASKTEPVVHPSGREKTPVVPNPGSSKPKGSSRRASRTTTGPAPQLSPSAPPSPAANRPNHRRRRSQSGQSNALPHIHVPPHDDNFLRPPRNRIGSGPHSAPLATKDTPPHLSKPFDIRNNIDALVERVRAVAMADNRPSTPGSHIDWAGDDDDSLPDLNDWGVTPAISAGEKEEMSPIIVDGLRSLPELVAKDHIIVGNHSSSETDLSESQEIPPTELQDTQSNLEETGKSSKTASSDSVGSAVTRGSGSATTSARTPLHPSLPAKPVSPDIPAVLPKIRNGPAAMPMRNPSPREPFNKPESKEVLSIVLSEQIEQPGTSEDQAAAPPVHSHAEAPPQDVFCASVPAVQNVDKDKDGLSASIHAPKSLLESASAPAAISSYPSSTTTANKTHIRAHTVGKPYPDSRPSRSGYSSPHSGVFSGGHHARTQSTPPISHRRSPNSQRPVLTGDALSRLARTIGSSALSPPRAAAVVASHD